MTNLLAQAINCDDADRAAKMIRDVLGIESDADVAGAPLAISRPSRREAILDHVEWLKTEARYLA